jgi:hypothetical protein
MAELEPARRPRVRVIAILIMVAGLILLGAGVATWFTVRDQLADEHITVSEDADHFAGDKVDGPFTAYSEAQTIEKHALEASGGLTYAELPQDDPKRQTVMTASFLRASLFTSVVAFGVAALAAGLGVVFILLGLALLSIYRASRAIPAAAGVAATGPAAGPAPESAAGAAPESAPAAAPESAPAAAPESAPAAAPESAPAAAPESAPAAAPESAPAAAPESAPGSAPESAPESTPRPAPESTPGPAPESAPESAPGPPRESEP